MACKAINEISIGRYTGFIADRYRHADFLKHLENIQPLLEGRNAGILSSGRNRNVKIMLSCNGRLIEFAFKAFGRQSAIKDMIDERKGSKARRTWEAASFLESRGVGTPAPVGFLEYRRDDRLIESYFITEYENNATSFKDELICLFRHDPECEKFMTLLQCVADEVRKMHEAGFLHNDLGNQNILLKKKGDSAWGDVKFVDLNRGRILQQLSCRQKARDISRIYLPSDLLRVFKEMCFAPAVPSAEFQKWEKCCRMLYTIHSGTRWLRHPIRTQKNKKVEHGKGGYPSEKDMWIWDERSGQPINVMKSRDRSRYHGLSRHLQIAGATVQDLFPVWLEYSRLLKTCYQKPVRLKERIGLAINPRAETADRELALQEQLGTIPVIVRFYAHESEKEWGFLSDIVKTLHGGGRSVSVALVQGRHAVNDPKAWALFVAYVLERVSGHVDFVEVGHAINRVKWGIWDFEEHRRLLEAVAAITDRYPDIKFTGPGVIDFEYPFLMAALKNVPEKLHFASLSHHLYVDRRGAPENRQGPFSALEKFALARAIAHRSPQCDDSLIISEVNWPLKGTGVYSPVGSPYESPGPRFNDPSVTEDEYAAYMLRYIVIALCSGMVDRLYWWRLVARGYGLVDDTNAGSWRKRPAYVVLQYFLSVLGEGEFLEKLSVGGSDIHCFMFRRPDGKKVCLAYSSAVETLFNLPFECSSVISATCETIEVRAGKIILAGMPVYFFLK